jgi:hypothetical protein
MPAGSSPDSAGKKTPEFLGGLKVAGSPGAFFFDFFFSFSFFWFFCFYFLLCFLPLFP